MRARLSLALLLVAAGVYGCNEDPAGWAPGAIRMSLVDATGDYDAVNVVVTEVSVHEADADSASGWRVVNDSTRTFDLVTLTNGASAALGQSPLSPGHYTQIRLKLGDGNTVTVDGDAHPLDVPSGYQTGIKLNHPFDIESGTLYELTLDFDADHSIHLTGAGEYQLSPVIRVVANHLSGSISGIVEPAVAHAVVSTVVDTSTVSTAADTTSGAFQLMALPAGTYSVHIAAGVGGYQDTTLTGVTVVATQNADVGTIILHP